VIIGAELNPSRKSSPQSVGRWHGIGRDERQRRRADAHGRMRGRLAQKDVSCLLKTEQGNRTLLLDANHAVGRQGPVVVLARHRERGGRSRGNEERGVLMIAYQDGASFS
jgi:hypothetical protein